MSTAHRMTANAKERAALAVALERVKNYIAACEADMMPNIRSEHMRENLLGAAWALGDALGVFNDARSRVKRSRLEAESRAVRG